MFLILGVAMLCRLLAAREGGLWRPNGRTCAITRSSLDSPPASH